MDVSPTGQSCGAIVTGLDLSGPVDPNTVAALRSAWLEHHVLVFPEQKLDDDALEAFAEYFGPIGDDPFIAPLPGKKRIAAIQRAADETSRIFAEDWHSDWSFMTTPPAGTCLYGVTIPPTGGDTLFANEHLALEQMPEDFRQRLEGLTGQHSAGGAYATDGKYSDAKYDGSMDIRPSDSARAVHNHPLIRNHPETGRPGLFAGSYVFDIDQVPRGQAQDLLTELQAWLARPEFVYRHQWQSDMLVMWDNRSVLHRATGGFEGHARLLHRLTVSDDQAFYLN